MFSSPRSFSINGTKDLEFFIRIVNSLFPFERSLQPFNIAKLINLAICGSVNRKTSSFFPTFLYPGNLYDRYPSICSISGFPAQKEITSQSIYSD